MRHETLGLTALRPWPNQTYFVKVRCRSNLLWRQTPTNFISVEGHLIFGHFSELLGCLRVKPVYPRHDWILLPWQLGVNLEDELAGFCIAPVGFFHSFTMTSHDKRIAENITIIFKERFSIQSFICSLNSASTNNYKFFNMSWIITYFTLSLNCEHLNVLVAKKFSKLLGNWSLHDNYSAE